MGQVGRAQSLGVHSVHVGPSRLQMRMRTTMMISIVLVLPLPGRDCPRFDSSVAGTGDRSCSAGEEARAFDGAFSTGHIVQYKRDGVRSATGTHHAGPSPLARSSLPWRPVTLKSTSLEAVVVDQYYFTISPAKKIFEACERFLLKPDKKLQVAVEC